MNERVLRVLEFTKICSLLSSHARSESGKALCLNLKPMGDIRDIETAQNETEEAVSVMTYSGQNPMVSFSDISPFLSLASKGATLNMKMLLSVAEVLRAAAVVRSSLVTDRENTPLITSCASLLQPLSSLCRDITDAILSEEELSDHASPELADIRRHIRQSGDRVREKLNAMAHGNAYAKYLMEPIVTVRSGRYVLPVRQEYRQFVPGLVHDQSATGATLYIEPMAVVELSNELREWRIKEKNEIDRILAAFSAQVGDAADIISRDIALLTRLDFIFAKASLARAMDAVVPQMNDEGIVRLNRARHPLIPADKVVPLTLRIGEDFTTLVITGPNTGGKTVSLKTLGLFCLMAQAGLQLPAAPGTVTAVFNEIYADIGDEQSIEQSLSTFSSHMKNIVEITSGVTERDLVLFDELGAGTDPTEGAALAQAILSSLTARHIRTAATTHYSELKSYALTTPGVENASVEFDVSTLRPTYRLSIGVPGKSNAFEISRRLGLDESLIDSARELLSHDTVRFEDVIANAEYHRQVAEKERELAEEARRETIRLRNEAENLYKETRDLRQNAERKAREEARRLVDKARREAADILQQMKDIRRNAAAGDAASLKKKLDRSLDELSDGIASADPSAGPVPASVKPGDRVLVLSLNAEGTVLTAPDSHGDTSVQVGSMKMKAPLASLRIVQEEKPKKHAAVNTSRGLSGGAAVPMSCDLRGMDLEEAIMAADRYLSSAYMAGLHEVTLIHGKGTGVLRSGIQQFLKRHSNVKSFRLGHYGEGEDGVTVVTFK
ncbi:MAG: endonuclease MutS2 [Clostridia bacterium]|nr:endonuclease MutS2 [Clostridia bacterium]